MSATDFSHITLYLLDALHGIAKMIDSLPHAHVGMITRAANEQIDRPIRHRERVFIEQILVFLELEYFMIELAHPLRRRRSDRNIIELPGLLPAVLFRTFLYLRMLLP